MEGDTQHLQISHDLAYGFYLHTFGGEEQYYDYYFETPWAYDELWAKAG